MRFTSSETNGRTNMKLGSTDCQPQVGVIRGLIMS